MRTGGPTHFPDHSFRSTWIRIDWIPRVAAFSIPGILLVTLLIGSMSVQLPMVSHQNAVEVVGTLTNYTFQAALIVPVTILVGVAGAGLLLSRAEDLPRSAAPTELDKARIHSLIGFTIYLVFGSLFFAIPGVIFVSIDLYSSQILDLQQSLRIDGAILAFLDLEIACLIVLLQELFTGRSR